MLNIIKKPFKRLEDNKNIKNTFYTIYSLITLSEISRAVWGTCQNNIDCIKENGIKWERKKNSSEFFLL